ncbi:hypothetical protein [Paludifilum halophilum]|uniref:Uncharacterized protein n=1 Tax=Paludifilum halophilum TaxID=1642702 RepID=A0A235B3D3_9BACL|nr:hypothetical protein [Paludifilum halophilum]OYD06135.1 hypothetical protein CHM34_17935 [Paludifilum halophilum]
MFLPEHGDRASSAQVGLDAWSGADKVKDARDYYKKFQETSELGEAAGKGTTVAREASEEIVEQGTQTAAKAGMGAKILSKVKPALSIGGTVMAGIDTYNNIKDGNVGGSVAGVGDMLLSAAPLVAGAAPPVAMGMAVAGAALFVGGKLYQHRETITKIASDPVGSEKEAWKYTKQAVSNAKDTAKKAWDKVTGWF